MLSKKKRCPHCGFYRTYHSKYAKIERDLPVLGNPLNLIVEINRFTQFFELIDLKQTNRFCKCLYEKCLRITIQQVSKEEKIAYLTLEKIFYSVAKEKESPHKVNIENQLDNSDLEISLDEVSVKKGHQNEKVLIDTRSGTIIA